MLYRIWSFCALFPLYSFCGWKKTGETYKFVFWSPHLQVFSFDAFVVTSIAPGLHSIAKLGWCGKDSLNFVQYWPFSEVDINLIGSLSTKMVQYLNGLFATPSQLLSKNTFLYCCVILNRLGENICIFIHPYCNLYI